MRSMEFSGRSVDEAIFHGLMEMGVTIDEVEIETIQDESKGLFGIGAKMAVVRLTERETPVVMDMEQIRREQQQERAPRAERSERGGRKERSRGGKGGNAREHDRGGKKNAAKPVDPYQYSEELAANEPAAKFLSELLEKMGVPSQLSAAEADGGLRIRIDTDTDGLLIGRRGETLDALQYLVSLYANHGRADYLRITLDTEGYRARREDTLIRLARREAARVRTNGRAVKMEPMNPYERRVLHSALQDFDGVTTYSEGEEPNRCVVIAPKND